MPKDMVKEGMTFALGLIKISGERFNKVVKQLEKRNKLSSTEGKKMVQSWISEQEKNLVKLRNQVRREALKTRVYSAKDLRALNNAVSRLSKEIKALEKKKKKAEKFSRKKKSRSMKRRTAAKKRTKASKRKPARKKTKRKAKKKRKR